jgi:hypothetical protein
MELEILRKKISTFRGEGGRVRITEDALLMEILSAWEQWTGPASGFYGAIGVSQKGISSIIGKAKKLRREGHFPADDFKEIKLDGSGVPAGPAASGPCVGIELGLTDGKVIRFPQVDQLLEFLKKAA